MWNVRRRSPGPPPAPPTSAEIVADLLLASAVLYGVITVAFRAIDSLVVRSFDDAFYFSRIAENLAGGLGSTFDGIHPTNGYQPLWQWMLVPLFSARGWRPETLFRLQLAYQVVLLAGAGLLFRRLMRTFVGGWPAAVGMVLFVFLVFHPSLNGMETALQVCALVLLPAFAWRSRALGDGGPRAAFGLGLLVGLAVLARLDLVFLPLVLAVTGLAQWLAGREPRAAVAARTAALMAGVALVVVPYLAWNRWAFGSWVPISGMLKSSFPAIDIVSSPPARLGVRGMLHLGLAGLFLVTWAAGLGRRAQDPARRYWQGMLAIACGTLFLHLLYSTLFMSWGVFRWHFLWYALVTCMVVPEGLRAAAAWERRRGRVRAAWAEAGAMTLVALLALAGVREVLQKDYARLPYTWHQAAYEASLWTRDHVPADAVMAMHDAGLFGYFSRRRVVNLDGVVNNLEYQRTLSEHHLGDYLRRSGVRYLVKHDFGHVDNGGSLDIHTYDHALYQVLSRLHHTWSDTLWLDRAREVYRSAEHVYQGRAMVLAIWELPAVAEGAKAR